MYRGNNKVAMASQQRIRKALLALLEREDFDSISTSALCREAAVSRQTFYNLYSSKEDVVVDLLGYYRYDPSVCEKYGNGCADLHVFLSAFADYLVTNAGLLRLLLRNGVFHLLYDSFHTSIDDWRNAQAGAEKCPAYRASFVAADGHRARICRRGLRREQGGTGADHTRPLRELRLGRPRSAASCGTLPCFYQRM